MQANVRLTRSSGAWCEVLVFVRKSIGFYKEAAFETVKVIVVTH